VLKGIHMRGNVGIEIVCELIGRCTSCAENVYIHM